MTRVLSIASYTFLPAHTGGQKGIALFNKYFSRNADFISITTKTNQNDLADYPTIALLSGGKSRYINILFFYNQETYPDVSYFSFTAGASLLRMAGHSFKICLQRKINCSFA
jgi:hypothetical protein